MNFFEKTIGFLSPRRALERARARMMLEFIEQQTEREHFRYDGATAGRRAYGWYAASSDANVELMGSLIWLRNRSRDMIRNNPFATKAVEELVGNTVGTGIVPQAKTGNAAIDKIIDSEWPYFVEQCDTPQRLDFYGMQALVMRSMAESGEELVRYRPRLAQDNLRIPLQLQILEADFLDQSRTMGLTNGHVMQGVQFDLIGRRIAYWLFSYHPGGVLILNPRGGIVSQPVPAEQIMHIYRVLRPGQVRGVPWLAPVMMAMRDLEDYCDAERIRKKVEACVVALVTQIDGAGGSPLGVSKSTDPNNNLPVEQFEPGMVRYLKPGQDVKFNNPQATGGYREYKMTELQAIGAGMGVPYEMLTNDLSLVNYSSYRAGLLSFRNTIEGFRWLTLVPGFCMPVRRRFIDLLVLLGKIPESAQKDPNFNLYKTQWTAPKFESVDPLKDTMAELKKIRTGTLTWSEAVVQNGYDPDAQLREIARINKMLDKLEIILDCDPRNVTDRGQEQPSNTEERTPSSKAAPGSSGEGLSNIVRDHHRFKRHVNGVTTDLDLLGARVADAQTRDWAAPVRTFVS